MKTPWYRRGELNAQQIKPLIVLFPVASLVLGGSLVSQQTLRGLGLMKELSKISAQCSELEHKLDTDSKTAFGHSH